MTRFKSRRGAKGRLRVLAFALLLGCRKSPPPAQLPPTTRALVDVGRDFSDMTPADVKWSEGELARMVEQIRRVTERDPRRSTAAILREAVFETLGFVREVDDTDLKFVLLPSVLRLRRGSCVGLGTLYLALAQPLNLPFEGVMRPGHFFVRFREGSSLHNVELLRRGEEMPDEWYEARFPIPGGGAREYARTLSLAEVSGIVEYDIGNERRRQNRLSEARAAYERAAKHFPDFAEAQASLGATLHLLGNLDAAEQRYRAALLANPNLPGLDRNIELLERERAAAR